MQDMQGIRAGLGGNYPIYSEWLNESLNTCQFSVMQFELHDLVNQSRIAAPRALKNLVNY